MSDQRPAATSGVIPALLVGDAVSFLVFAAMGRAEHQTGLGILAIVLTAGPFMAAWYPVALWLRAFKEKAVATPWTAVKGILMPWLLAWPLGLQLRALILDRTIPLSFAIVVFVTNLLLLALWRGAYAFFRRSRGIGTGKHED